MGAAESKPSGPQTWKSSGPSSVSHDLADSLQRTPETDGSRSRLVEAQIQARVAEELRALERKEAEALAAAHEKLASAENAPQGDNNAVSRFTVSKQVADLRKQLESRKQVRALPDEVEGARAEVVRCLTINDRRPLDCWEEVERFKAEVKKLESSWVDKITS